MKIIFHFAYFAWLKQVKLSPFFAYFALFIVEWISLYFALLCPSSDKENANTNSKDLSLLCLLCTYFAYYAFYTHPSIPYTGLYSQTQFDQIDWLRVQSWEKFQTSPTLFLGCKINATYQGILQITSILTLDKN